MKPCPSCQKANEAEVTQCECGYSFASGFVEPKWLAEEDERVARHNPAVSLPTGGASADGSLIGGIVLGLVCGCLGLGVAYLGKMGSETKRGALYGFLINFGLGAVARVLIDR